MKGNQHLWGTQEQMIAIHISTCKWSEHVLNLLCDCVVNVNVWSSKWDERRGFCFYSNNSVPQRIRGSCERTSLNMGFEVAIKMQDVPVCVCAFFLWVCVIWVTSSHLVLALWSQACFSFFSSFASQVAPTIWHRALKTRPSLSHQNGMKIYPHIPSRPVALSRALSLKSATDYKRG